ncbi:hypothetical protein KAR26_03015 [Candidatus Parcubacteria bacterium]|nr:hypothetical protein [Candidatus Parcubacteria bacterium]
MEADFQKGLKTTNLKAWELWKQGSKVRARNLWERIIKEKNCGEHTLTNAHLGLTNYYIGTNERKKALEHAKLTLFFPPREVTIENTKNLSDCAVALMEIGESDQAGILLREAMELNKILLEVAQDASDLEIHEKIYEQLSQNARNLGKLMAS